MKIRQIEVKPSMNLDKYRQREEVQMRNGSGAQVQQSVPPVQPTGFVNTLQMGNGHGSQVQLGGFPNSGRQMG